MRYPNTIKEVESLGDYRVWVEHERDTLLEVREGRYARNITNVRIYRPIEGKREAPTDEQTLAVGSAYCSELDDFNKKIGVMIALGRASKQLGLRV